MSLAQLWIPPQESNSCCLPVKLAQSGLTLFVSSHDWGESLNAYDRVIALDQIVLAEGTPEEVRCQLGTIASMGNHSCG